MYNTFIGFLSCNMLLLCLTAQGFHNMNYLPRLDGCMTNMLNPNSPISTRYYDPEIVQINASKFLPRWHLMNNSTSKISKHK